MYNFNVNEIFIDWLIGKLRERGWSNSELARRSKVAQSTVSMVISKQSNPGWDFCAAIARAFGERPDRVFRLAGLLPPEPEPAKNEDQLLAVFRRLSPEQQKYMLDSARGLSGQPKSVNGPPGIIIRGQKEPYTVPVEADAAVPSVEEIMDALMLLDEYERIFAFDYIRWRLSEQGHRRNSSGRRPARTEEQNKAELDQAIKTINFYAALNKAEPHVIESVINRLSAIVNEKRAQKSQLTG